MTTEEKQLINRLRWALHLIESEACSQVSTKYWRMNEKERLCEMVGTV